MLKNTIQFLRKNHGKRFGVDLINALIDHYYDLYYGVDTCKRDKLSDNRNIHFDYEPTRYAYLNMLFKKYKFDSHDHIIDFGCGKGRALIVSAIHGCPKITGVEINPRMYEKANSNIKAFKERFPVDSQIQIMQTDARLYDINEDCNKFFFFNPFHLKIFIYVINNIVKSYIKKPHQITLFFMGPRDSTITYMKNITYFTLCEYSTNPRYAVFVTQNQEDDVINSEGGQFNANETGR